MDPAARGADPGGRAAAFPRREKAASSINCKDFDSKYDDFERWISKFEKAVMLASGLRSTEADEAATLMLLYKQWLPLKLDETANSHLDNIDTTADSWAVIKTKLVDLLIDPHEKMRWRARTSTIKWDGKESIHLLATRVVRAVDKYDKHLPPDLKQIEYFTRFRTAFKKPLMRVIDMNCPEGHQTIEKAKGAIMRYQLASADDDEGGDGDPYKAVAFAAAHLQPDRATSLESAIAAIGTKMEDLAISIRSIDDRLRRVEDSRRDDRQRSDPRPGWSGDRRQNNSWGDRGYRDRGRSPRAYSPARPRDSYDNRPPYRPGRGDNRNSGDSRRPRYRPDSRESSGRNRPREGDRGGYSGQGGRQDNREGGRSSDRDGGYRESTRSDRAENSYRAIDTGDEYSPQASDAEEADQPSPRQYEESACHGDEDDYRGAEGEN